MSHAFPPPIPTDCAHASPACWRCERAWLHERVALLEATVARLRAPPAGAPGPETSLDATRAWLRAQTSGGACPCCDRPTAGKLYQRSLYKGLLLGLVRLARAPDRWVHISGYMSRWGDAAGRGGDYAKLRYWGLIDRGAPDDPPPGPGYYRMTPLGHAFVRGEATIQRYAFLRDGEPVPPEQLASEVRAEHLAARLSIHAAITDAGLDHDALWRDADPARLPPTR